MDVHATLDAPCAPDELFRFVDDLGHYPMWLDLTHRCEPQPASSPPAWSVELRAQLGPLARSKRLRMVRTVREVAETSPDTSHDSSHDSSHDRSHGRSHARFERHEVDGRRHSPWILDVVVTPAKVAGGVADGIGSSLQMHLHYGGRLWTGGVLERALTDQINRGRQRLLRLVAPER